MNNMLQKWIRTEKCLRVFIIIAAIVTELSFVSLGFIYDRYEELIIMLYLPIGFCMFIGWIALLSVYIKKVVPRARNARDLQKQGLGNVADDISIRKPTPPLSGICHGSRAFCRKRGACIIPYSEIAWIQSYDMNFCRKGTFVFHMKNGKRYSLKANEKDVQWLVDNYITRFSPDILMGNDMKQGSHYEMPTRPAAPKAPGKAKRIWSIVLLCIGGALLILSFLFPDSPVTTSCQIYAIPFTFIGLGLLISNLRNRLGLQGLKKLSPREAMNDPLAFFTQIRTRLKYAHLLRGVLCIAAAILLLFLLIMMLCFDTDSNISAAVIKILLLAGTGGAAYLAYGHLREYVDESSFHQMMRAIKKLGDPEAIALELNFMEQSPYTKTGDLRFNEHILFYSHGNTVTVIDPSTIQSIQSQIFKIKENSPERYYVIIQYGRECDLSIETRGETILPLMKELTVTYPLRES